MSWVGGMRVRLRSWLRRSQVERELEEEMRWHLDLETEKYVRAGMTPEEARRRAFVAFGGVERYRDVHRDVRGMRWVERAWYDLRYALAALLRSRAFTAAAVLTLALGIGANAAAFGMVDALLFRPPPGVGSPGGLYRVRLMVRTQEPDGTSRRSPVWASYPGYTDLRDRTEGLAELSAYWRRTVVEGDGSDAREVRAVAASTNYFSVLRVQPAAGRFWTEREGRRADPVVVLSYGFWERRFGGDRKAIGRTLVLSDVPMTIVGVAPPHFRGVDLDPVDVWFPLRLEARLSEPDILQARNTTWLWMVGRPAPAVTPAVAAARATATLKDVVEAHPDGYWRPSSVPSVDLVPVTDPFEGHGEAPPIPVWLLGVTAVVLLIACANVGGLLLARGAGRRRELAVRSALGASRGRIVQLLLIESLLLALAGGGVGLLLAAASSKLLPFLGVPPLDPLVDGRVMAFAFGVALATSLLVGLLPALRASRADIDRELKDGAPRTSFDRSRLRAALTVAQIALCVVLLVNAGLFVRSLRNVSAVDPGLDPGRLAVVSLRFQRGTSPASVWEVKREAVEQVRTLPGVASAELTNGAPFVGGLGMARLDPRSLGLPRDSVVYAVWLWVGPEYLETVGLPVLLGRGFDAADGPDGEPVVIVNEALARMYGGGQEALRRCIPFRERCARIVGVVADSRFFDPSEEPLPALYQPLSQLPLALESRARLIVRTRSPLTSGMVSRLRQGIAGLAPGVQFVDVQSMSTLLRPKLQRWRVATIVFTLAGGVAFLLAVVGLYGVIAYLVASRTHELGVRLALGARPGRVLGLVLREGARLSALGAGIGVLVTPWVAGALRHRMYGVRPTDPSTYLGIALLVGAVALATSLVSAWRVLGIDPGLALRSE